MRKRPVAFFNVVCVFLFIFKTKLIQSTNAKYTLLARLRVLTCTVRSGDLRAFNTNDIWSSCFSASRQFLKHAAQISCDWLISRIILRYETVLTSVSSCRVLVAYSIICYVDKYLFAVSLIVAIKTFCLISHNFGQLVIIVQGFHVHRNNSVSRNKRTH